MGMVIGGHQIQETGSCGPKTNKKNASKRRNRRGEMIKSRGNLCFVKPYKITPGDRPHELK
jgi:hypothetical protein